jgi:hypothetical protein
MIIEAAMERVRRKLAGADDGNRQMVDILTAVLTDGLPAVEAACAEAIAHGVHSADVVLNILARQRDPGPPATILTPAALTLRHAPIADCARSGEPSDGTHSTLRPHGRNASERMRKSRPVLAVNERPAIAAVAIGHREDPVAVTPQLAAPVAAIPEPPQDASAVPVDVAPATDSLPTPAAKHSRTSSRHVARREGYSHSARQSNHAGGYAGLW